MDDGKYMFSILSMHCWLVLRDWKVKVEGIQNTISHRVLTKYIKKIKRIRDSEPQGEFETRMIE